MRDSALARECVDCRCGCVCRVLLVALLTMLCGCRAFSGEQPRRPVASLGCGVNVYVKSVVRAGMGWPQCLA